MHGKVFCEYFLLFFVELNFHYSYIYFIHDLLNHYFKKIARSICTHVCVCMYMCIVYVCIYVYMHLCMYVCMHVCMYVTSGSLLRLHVEGIACKLPVIAITLPTFFCVRANMYA